MEKSTGRGNTELGRERQGKHWSEKILAKEVTEQTRYYTDRIIQRKDTKQKGNYTEKTAGRDDT